MRPSLDKGKDEFIPSGASETWQPMAKFKLIKSGDDRIVGVIQAWQCIENGRIRWMPVEDVTSYEAVRLCR